MNGDSGRKERTLGENKDTPRWEQEHTASRASCLLGVAHGSPPTRQTRACTNTSPFGTTPKPKGDHMPCFARTALFILLLFQHPFWFHSQKHPVRDNKFYGHPTQTPLYTTSVLYTVLPPSVQFSSVAQSCPILCDPVNRSIPGPSVYHQLPEFTQTHAHQVGDAIQPSHPLSSPSPPAPNPSQHQGLF